VPGRERFCAARPFAVSSSLYLLARHQVSPQTQYPCGIMADWKLSGNSPCDALGRGSFENHATENSTLAGAVTSPINHGPYATLTFRIQRLEL
jgi:hypothetical protein